MCYMPLCITLVSEEATTRVRRTEAGESGAPFVVGLVGTGPSDITDFSVSYIIYIHHIPGGEERGRGLHDISLYRADTRWSRGILSHSLSHPLTSVNMAL